MEARGFNYGVVKTKVSQRPWAYWYQCPYIDYIDGAPVEPAPSQEQPSPTPEPTPVTDSGRLLRYKKGQKMLRGEDVAAVQNRLITLGYKPGKVDGIYGPITEAAVIAFQTAVAIEADGIVGPVTRSALSK